MDGLRTGVLVHLGPFRICVRTMPGALPAVVGCPPLQGETLWRRWGGLTPGRTGVGHPSHENQTNLSHSRRWLFVHPNLPQGIVSAPYRGVDLPYVILRFTHGAFHKKKDGAENYIWLLG